MGLRSDLQAFLEGRPELEGVNIYAAGVDIVAAPCLVLNPGDPYLAPTEFGQKSRVASNLQVVLVTLRADMLDALDSLEDMRYTLTTVLQEFGPPRGSWRAFGEFGSVDIGGVMYATAVVDLLFADNDRGATPAP